MKKNIKTLFICIIIPVGVGLLSSLLTINGIKSSSALTKPPLAPPAFLFPIVWTILYILMGYASYLIYTADHNVSDIENALKYYIAQLAINFLWSIIFFNFKWYLTSFIVILLLWVLIFLTIKEFYNINKLAAYLMIPYLVWVSFATYITGGIVLLN